LGEITDEGVGEGWKKKIREINRTSEDIIAMLPNLKNELKKEIEMSIEVQQKEVKSNRKLMQSELQKSFQNLKNDIDSNRK